MEAWLCPQSLFEHRDYTANLYFCFVSGNYSKAEGTSSGDTPESGYYIYTGSNFFLDEYLVILIIGVFTLLELIPFFRLLEERCELPTWIFWLSSLWLSSENNDEWEVNDYPLSSFSSKTSTSYSYL